MVMSYATMQSGEFVVLLALTACIVEVGGDVTAAIPEMFGTDRKDSGYLPMSQKPRATKRRDPRAEPGGNLTDPH